METIRISIRILYQIMVSWYNMIFNKVGRIS